MALSRGLLPAAPHRASSARRKWTIAPLARDPGLGAFAEAATSRDAINARKNKGDPAGAPPVAWLLPELQFDRLNCVAQVAQVYKHFL
jgi:hypothetical protein